MQRYSDFEKQGIPVQFTTWNIVVNSERSATLLRKASEELHNFYVKKRGKKRKRESRLDSPDTDYMPINRIMHLYMDDIEVRPELFSNLADFDYLFLVDDLADATEIWEMSCYLDIWCVKQKGHGTNKFGSYEYVTIPDFNEAMIALKNVDCNTHVILRP